MELIVSVFAAVGAFLGTVAAHFVAHDAYVSCPRYARRLIERAASHLPPFERARYEEEWLADLQERAGVFAKFKHAFACLLCARTLSALSARRGPAYIEFSVPGVGAARLSFVAGIVALRSVERVFSRSALPRPPRSGSDALDGIEELMKKLHARCGELPPWQSGELDRFTDLLTKAVQRPVPSKELRAFGIKLILKNGRTADLSEMVRALGIELPSHAIRFDTSAGHIP
jgi:hypothetical protein